MNPKTILRAALTLIAGLQLSACVVEPAPVYEQPPSPPPLIVEQGAAMTAPEPPPPLPIYEQPECPGQGYLWAPGYWAWDGSEYYWVPGTWVLPPQPEVLWTPGWWGWSSSVYVYHAGYWGPHVGFYGGVHYGHGYTGSGYEGGRWDRGTFNYNTAVNNVNVTNIHNTYNTTVINNVTINRVSYNGGNGGVAARPTPVEERAMREPRFAPTAEQVQHRSAVSPNHGAAPTPRPGAFNYHGVMPAAHEALPRPGNEPRFENQARPQIQPPRPQSPHNPAQRDHAPPKQDSHPHAQYMHAAPERRPRDRWGRER